MIVLASTSTYVQYFIDSVAYGSLFALMALRCRCCSASWAS